MSVQCPKQSGVPFRTWMKDSASVLLLWVPGDPPPLLEGLSEVVAHEGVNQRVDGGVGVRLRVTDQNTLGCIQGQ